MRENGAYPEVLEKIRLYKTSGWEPADGLSWEERQRLLEKKLIENGEIIITSPGSLGRQPGSFEFSENCANWFIHFLNGQAKLAEFEDDEIIYRARKDDDGNIFLEDVIDDDFVNEIAFPFIEVPALLAELQERKKIMGWS